MLSLVAERARNPAGVEQQAGDRALHVHLDALVDTVILKGPDHLQTCPVANVG